MNRLLLAAVLLAAPSLSAQEPATRVYELAEVEAPPRPANVQELRAVLDSTYPAEKRAAGVGASVSVAFVVGTDGVPREVRVTQSTDAAFDPPTVDGVAHLRFTPATLAGQPVAVRVEMPITWAAPQASAEPDVSPTEPDANGGASQGAESGTYGLREVDEPPRLLNPRDLAGELLRRYPAELRAMGPVGLVYVRFIVNARGEVVNPTIVRSSDPLFDAPTLAAVRVLRYHPAQRDGRAVAVWVEQPISWTIHGAGPERPE